MGFSGISKKGPGRASAGGLPSNDRGFPAPALRRFSGTLISSRPVGSEPADIMDIAPTVLKYFAVPIPGDIDGKSIF